MMRIIVASQNPAKIEAVREAFSKAFPNVAFEIEGMTAQSGVKEQPTSLEEARQGAENRAKNARTAIPEAEYWVGLEAGIEDTPHGMASSAWVCVVGKERSSFGNSGQFFLPEKIARLVREGKELGEADDIVFGRTNSKQAEGAVGILSHHLYTRSDALCFATVAALIPFMNPELYSD